MKLAYYFSLVITVLLSGCYLNSTFGTKVDVSLVPKIKAGVSTKDNVLSLIGAPFSKNTLPDGTSTWSYTFTGSKTAPTVANTLMPGLAMYGMSSSDTNTQNLSITFNKSDVVVTCVYSSSFSTGNIYTRMAGGGERDTKNCVDVRVTQ